MSFHLDFSALAVECRRFNNICIDKTYSICSTFYMESCHLTISLNFFVISDRHRIRCRGMGGDCLCNHNCQDIWCAIRFYSSLLHMCMCYSNENCHQSEANLINTQGENTYSQIMAKDKSRKINEI